MNYTFHVIELHTIAVLGTALITSMLKRQVFPLHIPRVRTSRGKGAAQEYDARPSRGPRKQESQIPLVDFTPAQDNADQKGEAESPALRHKRTMSSVMAPMWLSSVDLPPPSPPSDRLTTSLSRDSESTTHASVDAKQATREAFESTARPPLNRSSLAVAAATEAEDAGW